MSFCLATSGTPGSFHGGAIPPTKVLCPSGNRRGGFTITELLVSMALILFIMAILSEAFVAALESFRQLKATGDMDRKLRGAVTLMRNDLRAGHFGENKRLSDPTLTFPPTQGFFRVFQGTAPQFEGVDADGIPSTRSTDSMLHFTINLGVSLDLLNPLLNRRENFLAAYLPGSPLLNQNPPGYQDNENYLSRWAEVAYFLKPTGTTTPGGGQPLYALYRRQRLAYVQQPGLLDLNNILNQLSSTLLDQYPEISLLKEPLNLSFLHLNTPEDLTIPPNRLGMKPVPILLSILGPLLGNDAAIAGVLENGIYPTLSESTTQQSFWGADLVLTDVVSFEVKVFNNDNFVDLFDDTLLPFMPGWPLPSSGNPAFKGSGTPRVYDTWTSLTTLLYNYSNWNSSGNFQSIPLNLRLKAIQVTIRIWDPKTQKTRQLTVVQDL